MINMKLLPELPKITKASMFREFFEDYGVKILAAVALIGVIVMTIVLSIHFTPAYTTQADVTSVGYKGITITCKGEYGEALTLKIDVDDVSKYQIGDTVTIKIKSYAGALGQCVEIVEETKVS